MIYVYCPRKSDGARDLVEAIKLEGVLSRRLRWEDIGKPGYGLAKEDVVVCWGNPWHWTTAGARVLNRTKPEDKLAEITLLHKNGISAPRFGVKKSELAKLGVEVVLPRKIEHADGDDLRKAPSEPDFYVEWLDTKDEYRIHVLDGKVIRLGMKIPREPEDGFKGKPHPWIRAYNSGWQIVYGGDWRDHIPGTIRQVAKDAVKALELDFGAVDLAVTKKGKAIVFEVNTSPCLKGQTVHVYAEQLAKIAKARG